MPQGKILLVDDELDTVKILKDLLENEGYEAITAYTGKRALERVKEEKPALVILDIMMPRMDGYAVCEKIKNDPETKNIKVIMLTARDSGESLQESLEKKADWFIAKPYETKHLLSMIAKLLSEGRQ